MGIEALEFLGFFRAISKIFDEDGMSRPRKINRVERKQPKISPKNREEFAMLRRQINEVKFTVLFLSHALFEEDEKLSMHEVSEIKHIIKDKKHLLDKEDIKELKEIIKSEPSIGRVIDFAKDNDIPYSYVLKTLHLLVIISDRDPRYKKIIQRIQRMFIVEKEYMK